MTPDRRSRVLRTALQAAIPALLLLLGNLTDVLPTLGLDGSGLIVAGAVLTTLTSLVQNLRDGRGDTTPEVPEVG